MKRLLRFASIVMVLAVVLLALPAQAFATKPEEVEFTFDLTITGAGTAEGTFVAMGAIEDAGSVYETFRYTDEGILQGTFVMTGEEGTITMRFHLEIIGGYPIVQTEGRFVIKSGTGAYENIHGIGTAGSEVDVSQAPEIITIDATFSGQVHIDP